MLKIFVQTPGAPAAEVHVFNFTSPTAARAEADAIKDALSKAVQQAKIGGAVPAAPGGSASSAAMAVAGALSAGPQAGASQDGIYDDARLHSDANLQQSLLKGDPQLEKTFVESLRTKPESITDRQFTSQFWSSRIHLLRAHAIERSQTRGSYNVLASIKPETKDNALRLSISKEQIQLIFNQHAVVRRAYDENVPKMNESEFWVKFFQSRLFKKLKGERITETDATNPILDKYLNVDDEAERAKRLMASHVPHIIDIEGNEENHSQRKGNKPDFTMRPASSDRVPIIRTLNTLSEKLLSQVAPNDIDPSLPIGVDEETYNSLALQDLRDENADERIILNIKDHSHLTTAEDVTISEDARRLSTLSPSKALNALRADLGSTLSASFSLDAATSPNEEDSSSSSSDDETPAFKAQASKARLSKPHKSKPPSAKSPFKSASDQILSSIRLHPQGDSLGPSNPTFTTAASASTHGLSSTTFDRLSLTHATTTEFLSHFWSAYLSGAPSSASTLPSLVESLSRALDRINAVAEEAEEERDREVEKARKRMRQQYEKTGRRQKEDFSGIGGGREVVWRLLGPTVKAVERAVGEYKRAVAEAGVEEGPG